MNIAIYVRVSTQLQSQAQTIEQQLERLQDYAKAQQWNIVSVCKFSPPFHPRN